MEINVCFKADHPNVDSRVALMPHLKEQEGSTRFAARFCGKAYAVYKAKLKEGTLHTDNSTRLVVVTLKENEIIIKDTTQATLRC